MEEPKTADQRRRDESDLVKLDDLKRQLELEGHIAERQRLLRAIWRLENSPDRNLPIEMPSKVPTTR